MFFTKKCRVQQTCASFPSCVLKLMLRISLSRAIIWYFQINWLREMMHLLTKPGPPVLLNSLTSTSQRGRRCAVSCFAPIRSKTCKSWKETFFSEEAKEVLCKHINDQLIISSNCSFDGIIQPVPFWDFPFHLVFLKAIYLSPLATWTRSFHLFYLRD